MKASKFFAIRVVIGFVGPNYIGFKWLRRVDAL